MRKKNFKGRCEKRHASKCEDVCRTYDDIQRAYLDKLEANKNIKSIRCNVPLKGPAVEEYSTDFVCIRVDGEMMVRECVFRRFLTKPLTLKLLDMSLEYVRNRTEITEAIIEWLYEHSAGVISIVVSLIHDAQEIAILNGRETLDIVALNEAYQRMQMIHRYVKPAKPRASQVSKPKAKKSAEAADVGSAVKGGAKTPDNVSVAEIVADAKNGNRRVVDALREHFSVEEVAV